MFVVVTAYGGVCLAVLTAKCGVCISVLAACGGLYQHLHMYTHTRMIHVKYGKNPLQEIGHLKYIENN